MKTFGKWAWRALLTGALVATGVAAQAQKFEGPLKIVVGYAPGGATDRAARLVGQALETKLGVSVIVENKPGAGGRLAAQQVKAAGMGDNVLILGNPAVFTVAPLVFKDVSYDPDTDFVPVSQVNAYTFAVVAGPAAPVQTVAELEQWLKAHPDKAFFGVPATGSLPHFFALMLGDRASIKTDVVGYKGSAPLATELLGGQIPFGVDTFDTVLPLHQTGKLKIIAMSGKTRSPLAKDIPTLKESGVDLVAEGWNALFAPKSMPPARIKALASAVHGVMSDPAVRKHFEDANMEPVASTQEQTEAMLKAYNAQWRPVVKRSGYQQ
ncbi:MAG: ABC transporter substrate-binding protein [Gammaproteobacteria bacterium]|nr:ABC transporter substrate-binding protein [Gammaproteobacteria bacterium]